MRNFQRSLFYLYEAFLALLDFYRKYHALFSALDLTGFTDLNIGVGCTGYSRHAIPRAFLVKHLEEM